MNEQIFTQEELAEGSPAVRAAEQATAALSDDEKSAQRDRLEEAADRLNVDGGRIPEKFLEPDREIQDAISKDYMDIGANHSYLVTCWVNYVNINGQMVWRKKAEGWQVATVREFPEAKHLVREDGTIRVGDVILMCIRMDKHLAIQKRQEELRLKQQYGLEADAIELAAKYPDQFKIHSDQQGGIPANIEKRMQSRAAMAAGARKIAATAIGERMKKGTIPGVPIK